MKKILITGGTGFIGSAISNYFCKKGYKITILDNNSRGNLRRINQNKVPNLNIIEFLFFKILSHFNFELA